MERPVRKHPRLKSYDYGQNGCYFVTICTQGRKHLLGRIDVCRAGCPQPAAQALPQMRLTHIGALVTHYIKRIPQAYPGIDLAHYVVMPNHIHLLLTFREVEGGGVRAPRPTLPTVVRSLKTMVTRQLGYSIFQASFTTMWCAVNRNLQKSGNTLKKIQSNGRRIDITPMPCEMPFPTPSIPIFISH